MIGESEINVLLLPKMSRAERAGRAKKPIILIVLPSGGAAAAGGAIGRSSTVATLEGEVLCITPFSLYPASSVLGRDPVGLVKSKLLLKARLITQATRNGQQACRLGQAIAELDRLAMN